MWDTSNIVSSMKKKEAYYACCRNVMNKENLTCLYILRLCSLTLAAASAAWISFFCASNSLSKAAYLGCLKDWLHW